MTTPGISNACLRAHKVIPGNAKARIFPLPGWHESGGLIRSIILVLLDTQNALQHSWCNAIVLRSGCF